MKKITALALSFIFYLAILPTLSTGENFSYKVHNLTGDGGTMSNVRVPADNVFLVAGDNTLTVNDAVTAWMDVRAFIPTVLHAGIAAGTYTGDVWAYLDNAAKHCNDNNTNLYMPDGDYYTSQPWDTSAQTGVKGTFGYTIWSDAIGFSGTTNGARIHPHSSFTGGTALAPTYLMIIDRARGMYIKNIGFEGNYPTDGKYIAAIGVKNSSIHMKFENNDIYDLYAGWHIAYDGDANNDDSDIITPSVSGVDYGIINSGTQSYSWRIYGGRWRVNKRLFTSVLIPNGIGQTGGGWTFIDPQILLGADNSAQAIAFEVQTGPKPLRVYAGHFEPLATTIMPGIIKTVGTYSGLTPILFDGMIISMTSLVDAAESSSYPVISITNGGAEFKNLSVITSRDFWVDYGGRNIVSSSMFQFSTAGKQIQYLNYGVEYRNSQQLNSVSGAITVLNTDTIIAKNFSESVRFGVSSDATNAFTHGDNVLTWREGSFMWNNSPSISTNSWQNGWSMVGGVWRNTYAISAPQMRTPPDNNASPCIAGSTAYANNYFYWCYSTDNWRRVAYDNTW